MTTVNKEPGERVLTLGPKGQMMDLEVPLSDADLQAMEKRISDLSARAFALEEQKKEVVKPIAEEIKDVKAQEKQLLAQRAKGTTTAPVLVETRGDTFRREKWVVRLDTNPPTEVPDTRVALTDEDLQLLMSGITIKGGKDDRPDAEVLPLFAAASVAPPAESPPADTGPWHQELPGYLGWVVSEVKGKNGAEYMLASGDAQAWGPYGWNGGLDGHLHHLDAPDSGLNDATRQSLAEALGLEPEYDVNEAGTKSEPHETEPFKDFLRTLEKVVGARAAELAAPAPAPPLSAPKLYEASGHPGWRGYVHEELFYIRPPNVEASEPAASEKDKGPFEWSRTDTCLETAKGYNAGKEFLEKHDKLLAEFDFTIRTGKITEPIRSSLPPAIPESEPKAGSNEPLSTEARPEPSPMSPAELAADQTDNGKRILKALAAGPSSSTASTLGTKTGCGKPGAALNHLMKQGLVEKGHDASNPDDAERWWLTDLGKQVAAVLVQPPK